MGLRIIETYNGAFALNPEARATLFDLLQSDTFLAHIAQVSGTQQVQFTELLFQPVPYSTDTPKGMPAEFEKFHSSSEHTIVNVPPQFMFQAKIFKPSRLCAIYRHVGHT